MGCINGKEKDVISITSNSLDKESKVKAAAMNGSDDEPIQIVQKVEPNLKEI